MFTNTKVWDALNEAFGERQFLLLSIQTVEDFVAFYAQANSTRGVSLNVEQSLAQWADVTLHMELPAGEEPLTIPGLVTFATSTHLVVQVDTSAHQERWAELGEDFGIVGDPGPAIDPRQPPETNPRQPLGKARSLVGPGTTEDELIVPSSDPFPIPPLPPSREPGLRDSRDLPLHAAHSSNAPASSFVSSQNQTKTRKHRRPSKEARTALAAAQWATPPRRCAVLPYGAERADLLAATAGLFTLFAGSLEDCTIRDWLNDARGRKEHGICTVTANDAIYHILLRNGGISDVQVTPEGTTSLTGFIRKGNIIGAEKLAAAEKQAMLEGLDVGNILLAHASTDEKTIAYIRHARVAYLMHRVAELREGSFAYTPVEFLPYVLRLPAVKY